MKIIPAIDIIDGQCVRLTQGDYAQMKVYNQNPVEVAQQFEAAGIKYLHVVDLDGAKASHIVNHKTLQSITANSNLHVDFGGGIKTDEDIRLAFQNGAKQITAGSIAIKSRDTVIQWLKGYGSEKIILGADVKGTSITVSGWQENSNIDLYDFLTDYTQQGIQYVICTDIEKDGMLKGSSIELYRSILTRFPNLKLIASGGVNGIEDLKNLKAAGLYGAIVGKAIYEGKISLTDLAKFN